MLKGSCIYSGIKKNLIKTLYFISSFYFLPEYWEENKKNKPMGFQTDEMGTHVSAKGNVKNNLPFWRPIHPMLSGSSYMNGL
jgi:hypothetical protein